MFLDANDHVEQHAVRGLQVDLIILHIRFLIAFGIETEN